MQIYFKLAIYSIGLLVVTSCTLTQRVERSGEKIEEIGQSQSLTEAKVLYEIGKENQAKGKYNEALIAYEKALMLDDANPDFYNGLGVIYSLQGEHAMAVSLIREAIKIAPMASYLHNNLGYVYLSQQLFVEAAGAFERALQLDPGNVHARQNLDLTYKKLGCSDNQPPCGQWQEPSQP